MTVTRLPLLAESPFDQQPIPGRPNPYWDEVRRLRLHRDAEDYVGTEHAIPVENGDDVRPRLVLTYAHAIPTPCDINWITDVLEGRKVVEIAAGGGYWAWQLHLAGVDVRAFDRDPYGRTRAAGPTQEFHPVEVGEHDVAAAYPERALMLCWPPSDDPLAVDALRTYTGDLLIYIGEPVSGCTGDRAFFDELEASWSNLGHSPHHVTYGGNHCRVQAYLRTGTSRPTV